MKIIPVILLCIIAMSFVSFEPNFETAKQTAKIKHELILLNFSGSDWCGPCMRMRKEIFDSEGFTKMAESNLVFVNADFPRNKKNQLDKATTKQNEALADKYNPNGNFPFTVLMTAEGKVLKSWEGMPDVSPAAFTEQIKGICDANK